MKELIRQIAGVHGLDPAIVYGVCMAESNMNQFAVRFETSYRWLFRPENVKPLLCSLQTEIVLQKTSWGLMQVMGAVYREYGYKSWLSELPSKPDEQLSYGCRHLMPKIRAFGLRDGLSAYNAGSPTPSNKSYVDKILDFAEQWDAT